MEFYVKNREHDASLREVSIPNGMEFYSKSVDVDSAIPCFNSQRDGILRYFGKNLEMRKRRFNSQRDGILRNFSAREYAPTTRFNSQRDGILLSSLNKKSGAMRVSIPNGMEFYRRLNYRSW